MSRTVPATRRGLSSTSSNESSWRTGSGVGIRALWAGPRWRLADGLSGMRLGECPRRGVEGTFESRADPGRELEWGPATTEPGTGAWSGWRFLEGLLSA